MPSRFDAFLSGKPTQQPAQAAPAAAAPPTQAPAEAPSEGQGVGAYVPPALQDIGAGIVQGARDIGQTGTGAVSWLERQMPGLASIDPGIGTTLNDALARQTEAFQQAHGSSLLANLARAGSGIALTAPLTGGIGALAGGAARALGAGRILAPAIEGAIAGGGSNLLVSGGYGENPLTAAATGALGGGVLGGGLGYLAGRAGGMGAASQAMADRLGIDLSYGQRAGGVAKKIEDATEIVPGSGAAKFAGQQNQQIAGVLARNAGMPGKVAQFATPELEQARQAAGGMIGNAASRITVQEDPQLWAELARTEHASQLAGASSPEAQVTSNLLGQVTNIIANRGGQMTGHDLATFISRGSALDRALNWTGTNQNLIREYAGDIRQSLIDAAIRSPQTDPAALTDLGNARYAYKVIKSIEPIIQRTPEGTETMNYPGLAQAIRKNFDMSQAGTGAPRTEMQDLAQLLSGPLASLKSSGTAERSQMYRMLGIGGPTALGASPVLWALGHPGAAEATALATGAPMAAAALAGRAMRFGPNLGTGPVARAFGAYRGLTNPLLPRAMGPMVGNALTGQQPGAPQ